MKNTWDKILLELSYRVSSGIPDLTNEQHLMKLWDILKEHNWNIDARVELLKNLDEQDKPSVQSILNRSFKNAQSGRMIKVSSALGYKNKPTGQAAYATAKGMMDDAGYGEEAEKITKQKGGEADSDLSTTDVETDDFKRIELSEEERQQRRQTDKEECELWLTEDETTLKNKFKEEEGKGAAGTAQSKAGEAVTVWGGNRVRELLGPPNNMSIDEAIAQTEKELQKMMKDNPKGLLTQEWITAGLSIVRKLDKELKEQGYPKGLGNVEEIGWDTDAGRDLVGTDDQHGTSSDMFIKMDDGRVIGESLKKDFKVFLVNGGYATAVKELQEKIGVDLPENVQYENYKKRRAEESNKIKERIKEELDVKKVVDTISEDPNIFISKMCSSKVGSIRNRLTEMFGEEVVSKLEPLVKPFESVSEFLKNLSPEQRKQAADFINNLDGAENTDDLKWIGVLGRHPEAKKIGLTDDIRQLSNELVDNLYDFVKPGSPGNKQFKQMVVKDLHFQDLLFGTPPRLDEFNLSHGEDPAVRIQKGQVQELFGISDEEIEAAKNDPEKQKAIMNKIQDQLVITKKDGVPIISVKVEGGTIPLYTMGTRARGLNAAPTLEIQQHPLGTFTLKNGTPDYKKWPQEDRRGFGDTETKALNKLLNDDEFDYESNKAEIQERMKMLEEIDPDHPSLKKIKKKIKELEA